MGSDFELNISPTIDNYPSSTFELQLAEGSATPLSLPNETNSMFILTAKLTSFATDDIVIGLLEALETGRKTNLVDRNHEKEEANAEQLRKKMRGP
ncbi:hypothetical protein Csa_016742 [Cucumis sativus]|uniref:Uncharacterized protein n=1 Tax=Cucumis sativus TaxID=3659 RepID=A0A0A0K4S9_CUCSA|nr:hypothetical protein Csa_016742 [Cucumis sativus]